MSADQIIPLALGVIIFSFLTSFVLIVPFIDLLYKLKLTRQSEQAVDGKESLYSKMHAGKTGTPTGGGILLVSIITIVFVALIAFMPRMGIPVRAAHRLIVELFIILFTFISYGLLGLTDDYVKIFGKGHAGDRPLSMVYGLGRREKFIIQWVIAFIVGFVMYRFLGIQILHIPLFGAVINLGVFYIPFAAFVIVFFANAFNITDGLDGLSSGLLVIFLLAFEVIAASAIDTPLWMFISIWIGSLLAFLYFNTYPARIFLGDVGALAFGSMIGVVGLLTGSIFPLFVVGGMFVLEASTSAVQIFWWKVFKKPLLPVAPLHLTLQSLGWEEPKIVMRAWLGGIMLAILGLWLAII